jgi:TPR repeat protein
MDDSGVPSSLLLRRLYEEDVREHGDVPAVGTPEYVALRARDRTRRGQAQEAVERLREASDVSPRDVYHAAWLFNHGETPADALRAHEWALEAAEAGHDRARWLAAASYDRWCMYEGRPQKYGTQFVPDGVRYRLWDVDPDTTDAERARWDVPPVAEQLRRADEMSLREPQPPLDEAPQWLKDALKRWTDR